MSNIGSRRKNPLNLSLPATVKENDADKNETIEETKAFSLDEQLKQMALTEPQKQRMQEWIKEKKLVCYVLIINYYDLLGSLLHFHIFEWFSFEMFSSFFFNALSKRIVEIIAAKICEASVLFANYLSVFT